MIPPQTAWSIPGPHNSDILGNTHAPRQTTPRATVLLCHGLKGYKDYGFFPILAQTLAHAGYTALRFNFSHSGMTNNLDTFERPDLFEQDTWLKQVQDLQTLSQAVTENDPRLGLPPQDSKSPPPIFWFGHSRGGNTALLSATDPQTPDTLKPAALVTAAAPKSCLRLDDKSIALLERDGRLATPSYRTGQTLYTGRAWLDEQRQQPDRHNPLDSIAKISCPALLIHGSDDPTVPVTDAHALHESATHTNRNIQFLEIQNANHTFNAPNPLPIDTPKQDLHENTRALFTHTLAFFNAQSPHG